MRRKFIFLIILLLMTILLVTGCSLALPWAKKVTPDSSPTENTSSASANSVTPISLASNFSINIPNQSFDKTIYIPGVTSNGQKVFVNDKEVATDPNGNFIVNVDLIPGINHLTFKVFSKDGSSVYSSGKNVTYTPQIPKLSINPPLPNSYTSENPTITIVGITDPNCEITTNGTNLLPDVNGNFIVTVPLKSGENIIKLESRNPSGLVNSLQQVINFTKVEKKPKPKLVLSLPDKGFVSTKDITINGFTDPKNIIEVYNNYDDSRNTIKSLIFKGSINNGTFAIPVSLSVGTNNLLIRATNEFDQYTEQKKILSYKK